jgi:hypothetical protein
LQSLADTGQANAGGVRGHAEHRSGLRRVEPVAGDKQQQLAVLGRQAAQRRGERRREPGGVDRGIDHVRLVRGERGNGAEPVQQPLPADERTALPRQHVPADPQQPRQCVAVRRPEPASRHQGLQERLGDQVRDITGADAVTHRVGEHPLFMPTVEATERGAVPSGRRRQQLTVSSCHTHYLPAPAQPFQRPRPQGLRLAVERHADAAS